MKQSNTGRQRAIPLVGTKIPGTFAGMEYWKIGRMKNREQLKTADADFILPSLP
jgi:hypothetical protein